MKTFKLETKLLNHLTKSGSKKTSEKIIFKSLQKLHKESYKDTKEIVKKALINSTPAFRIQVIKSKKNGRRKSKIIKKVPYFIISNISRLSLAMKCIITVVKKTPEPMYNKLKNEVLLNSQEKGESVGIKTELHKQVLKNKRYFNKYRWKEMPAKKPPKRNLDPFGDF
jgi:ribosomal protein S7